MDRVALGKIVEVLRKEDRFMKTQDYVQDILTELHKLGYRKPLDRLELSEVAEENES